MIYKAFLGNGEKWREAPAASTKKAGLLRITRLLFEWKSST